MNTGRHSLQTSCGHGPALKRRFSARSGPQPEASHGNGADLSAGDFVRWCRQVVDLLDQVHGVAGDGSAVGVTAATAVRALRRGVVALGMGCSVLRRRLATGPCVRVPCS